MSISRLVSSAPPERFFGYYPGTVAVVTAQVGSDRNVLSVGWHAALSADPALYGVAIGRQRYTHQLITASGAFAVHFLPFEHARTLAAVGSSSRNDGVDKFARFELSAQPGVALKVPILQQAYLAYECQVEDVHETGDHDWFVGKVVALHHDPAAFNDLKLQNGGHTPGAVYYGRSTYEQIGRGEMAVFSPDDFR